MGLSTYSVLRHTMNQNPHLYKLSQQEVKSVQEILLQMMDDIHSICVENELHYVISGGCALGAVRHGGFIPWDDDIDICMPRKDYEKLRQCVMKRFPDKYYVQDVRTCADYDLNFMKIRLNGTEFCEFLDPEPDKAGVFIDVFSIENVAENRLIRMVQGLLADGMQFICSCIRIRIKRKRLIKMAGNSKEAVRSIRIKSLLAIPFCIIPFHRWLIWTERILAMNKIEDSTYVAIPTGGRHFRGELYPREWLFPEREIAFDDRTYFAMAHIECYLKQMYGDYQKVPSEMERERHVLMKFSLPN